MIGIAIYTSAKRTTYSLNHHWREVNISRVASPLLAIGGQKLAQTPTLGMRRILAIHQKKLFPELVRHSPWPKTPIIQGLSRDGRWEGGVLETRSDIPEQDACLVIGL